jgi:signal transduction histidine kinase
VDQRLSRALVVDVALGVLVFGVLATAITANLAASPRQPAAAYGFAVGLGALMLVRRRWPVATLLVTAAALLGYYALDFPPVGLAVPVAAALYSAAEAGRVRWAIGTAVALVVVSTFFRVREGDDLAYLFGYEFAVTATLLAAVIALGDGVRSRRRWRAELRRQADAAQAEREREAARRVEQERLRIARELHDVLAHTISVVSLHSDVARENLREDPDAAEAALRAVRTATHDASRELRATLQLLREPGTADHRQPPAGLAVLDSLVRAAADGGVRVEVRIAGEVVTLPAVVEATAYRVVQESITNVLRHAGARTATVELHYRGAALTVRVSDDGDSAASGNGSQGYGIAGMRERVALLGGALHAGHRPDGGFVVEACLPVPVSA